MCGHTPTPLVCQTRPPAPPPPLPTFAADRRTRPPPHPTYRYAKFNATPKSMPYHRGSAHSGGDVGVENCFKCTLGWQGEPLAPWRRRRRSAPPGPPQRLHMVDCSTCCHLLQATPFFTITEPWILFGNSEAARCMPTLRPNQRPLPVPCPKALCHLHAQKAAKHLVCPRAAFQGAAGTSTDAQDAFACASLARLSSCHGIRTGHKSRSGCR